MMKLAAVAGAKGNLAALDERAFVARTVFAQRRPDKIPALLQVQGLALVERDPAQRERGLALLRDAVELREAQHSHYGGSRERVGEAFELLARGLIAAEQADEAVSLVKQSLAIHELEYGAFTERAHELRRLLFVAQVASSKLEDAHLTQNLLTDPLLAAREYEKWIEESLWVVSVFEQAGVRDCAENKLKALLVTADQNGLDSLKLHIEHVFAEYGMEP